uniref:Uncharacterized protein n=1 Tax=Acrobeloides nanus TaxID=290746 RepID=A0A914D1W5_9BILA
MELIAPQLILIYNIKLVLLEMLNIAQAHLVPNVGAAKKISVADPMSIYKIPTLTLVEVFLRQLISF